MEFYFSFCLLFLFCFLSFFDIDVWSSVTARTQRSRASILPRFDRQLQQDHGISVDQRLVVPEDTGRQRIPRLPQRVRRRTSRRQQGQREAQTPRSILNTIIQLTLLS